MDLNICSCPAYQYRATYNDKYDAYYCATCNKWSESQCDDAECEYCAVRPESPPIE